MLPGGQRGADARPRAGRGSTQSCCAASAAVPGDREHRWSGGSASFRGEPGSRREPEVSLGWPRARSPAAARRARTAIWAMVGALSAVSRIPGRTAAARWMKSVTASLPARLSRSEPRTGSGRSRDGTGNSCSPVRCNGTRLVARTVSPGAASMRRPTAPAASTTCSTLSRTSNSSRFAEMISERVNDITAGLLAHHQRLGDRLGHQGWRLR